ncbi:MAG: hypothetical protein NWR72_12890 [Bacteroidia bacterium]|nr:hypothetical protein [Bacteroidia bacterium]
MKQFSILFIHLLSLPLVQGQNNFFLPFGQSPDEVRTFLQSRDYVDGVEEDSELRSLRVKLDPDKQVEYAFDSNGVLYATTITRQYRKKRDAAEIEAEVLEYMQVVSQGQMKKKTEGPLTCHTAIVDTRVIKLFVLEHSDGKTLTLTSLSRQYGPPLDEEDLFYEDDILNRRFISN